MTMIDPNYYLANQTRSTPGSNLGKEEFLKILLAQLQNQDPLNPMEDKEFISQMANFSSLEQMMNMTKSIDSLAQSQQISPVLKFSHLIEKVVSYTETSENTGEVKTGKVVAVSQFEGEAILELDNGEKIYAETVTKIENSTHI